MELSKTEFNKLPLLAEGNSKEVRYLGEGLVAIMLKPTVYSYTHNRAGVIDGSDKARLRAVKTLANIVKSAGLKHAYRDFTSDYIISDLIVPSGVVTDTDFFPKDLSTSKYNKLARECPIETIAKRYHTGTPKHRYFNMSNTTAREGNFSGSCLAIKENEKYPELVIRFDWRNPMLGPNGERLADEVLPDQMANWYIDTEKAKFTARVAFSAISRHLKDKGLELWDMCFFIAEDGSTIFSEISPDCMRVKALDESLDKDLWRSGNSSELVLNKWNKFADLIETDII
jgi:phosphoribosylaminoimidazole-succinocarboxamide synthase